MNVWGGEMTWDLGAYMDAVADEGMTPKQIAKRATDSYMQADIGGVTEITGTPWPWCPAWFARFYEGPALVQIDGLIDLAKWARRDQAWVIKGMNAKGLTAREETLFSIIWNALDKVREEQNARQAAEDAHKQGGVG